MAVLAGLAEGGSEMKIGTISSREFLAGTDEHKRLPEITGGVTTCAEQFVGTQDALLWKVAYVTDVGGFEIERIRQTDGTRIDRKTGLSYNEMFSTVRDRGIEDMSLVNLYCAADADADHSRDKHIGIQDVLLFRLTRVEREAIFDLVKINKVATQRFYLDAEGLMPRALEMLVRRGLVQKFPHAKFVRGTVEMVLTAKGDEFSRQAWQEVNAKKK